MRVFKFTNKSGCVKDYKEKSKSSWPSPSQNLNQPHLVVQSLRPVSFETTAWPVSTHPSTLLSMQGGEDPSMKTHSHFSVMLETLRPSWRNCDYVLGDLDWFLFSLPSIFWILSNSSWDPGHSCLSTQQNQQQQVSDLSRPLTSDPPFTAGPVSAKILPYVSTSKVAFPLCCFSIFLKLK